MPSRPPQEWINEKKTEFFEIGDFVSKIKLNNNVLSHAQDTGEVFEKYLEELAHFSDNNDYTMMYYWLDLAAKELRQSVKVERNTFGNKEMLSGNLFFDSLNISHERLKKIHRFVCEYSNVKTDNPGEYRKKENVTVGDVYDGEYITYWYPPEKKDIKMIEYRIATNDDIELLMSSRLEMLKVVNQLPADYEYSEEMIAESREYFLRGDHITVLAIDGENVVGCASVSFFRIMPTFSHPTGKRAHLMNVYTSKDYRRQGIGRKMVDMLIRDAWGKGATEISLDATEAGRPLYRNCGFEDSGECMVLTRP